MTSTRLPGKVLAEVAGRPLIAHQIRRLQACRAVDDIVIATTTNATDDPLLELARQEGVGWFRGDEQDVLGRYVGAARQANAEVVLRLTSDCPLIDPEVTDHVIAALTDPVEGCDYASNVIERSYPRGLDVEAFWYDTLSRMDRLGRSPAAREHVTVFLRSERPDLFLRRDVVDAQDNSDLRWTVDTPADLTLIKRLYEELGLAERIAPYREILAYVRATPHLMAINAEVTTWTPPTP
ncbi:MAG: glycosyltransferase family protein [Anaerolineales bacterium]|nr:glycosyltransferase family protein [Anaerolineales bacterium]